MRKISRIIRRLPPDDIERLTRISAILSEIHKNQEILSYRLIEKRADSIYLVAKAFEITYMDGRSFNMIFRLPKNFRPRDGVEIAVTKSTELLLYIGENCTPQLIRGIVAEQIRIRQIGFRVENKFSEEMLDLITNDAEFAMEVIGIEDPAPGQDKKEGIDKIVNLSDGTKMPIQIKSNYVDLEKHKKRFPQVPGLVLNSQMNGKARLRACVLQMSKAYKIGKIEHL